MRGPSIPAQRFVAKVAGLVLGLLFGQGSVLLLQTYMIANGQLSTVASLGFALAVLSLVQWAADWGGLILLARHAVQQREFEGIWAANIARLIVATPTMVALAAFAQFYMVRDTFTSGILFGGLAIAPIWAFNVTGFLDGHGKSALSGPLAGLPWTLVALATAIALHIGEEFSFLTGLWVGGAYAAGCALCVVTQYALAQSVTSLRLGRLRRTDIIQYLTQGGLFCLGDFPGQIYARLLIFIVSESFDHQTAGVYIYVRQITSAAAQFLGVLKRVEFPGLASALTLQPVRLSRIARAQSANLMGAVGFFLIAAITSSVNAYLPHRFSEIAFYLGIFSAALPLWAIATSLGQTLILSGRTNVYSGVMIATIMSSGLLTMLCVKSLGLGFVAFTDCAMFLTQFGCFLWYSRERSRSS